MKWEEMIQMRRLKEAVAVSPFDLKIPAHLYQVAIERALSRLAYTEHLAIALRFQHGLPISSVADDMSMSWDSADRLIDGAVSKIRNWLKGSAYEFKLKIESEHVYERFEAIY